MAARFIYPKLPEVLDEESLALLTAFAPGERRFVERVKAARHRYLRALYLKAMARLGHGHYRSATPP